MSEKKPEKNVRGVSVMKFCKKIQGESNQNWLIQMLLTLDFDFRLVKSKCVWECYKVFSKIVNKQLKNENKFRPTKRILAVKYV